MLKRKIKKYGFFLYITVLIIFITIIFRLQLFLQLQYQQSIHTRHKFDKFKHKLAIIVPFRDRDEELKMFVPHMHKFLAGTVDDLKIFIINQNDSFRFNRASLINIGYLVSKSRGYDYMAMHDVDLMPNNALISYAFPNNPINHVIHLTPSGIHPMYNYPTFIGGVLILSHALFSKVDGMSNKFWGWGREDDEFYMRLMEVGNVQILKPQNITTGKKTFLHLHDKQVRKRDMKMTREQHRAAFKRDKSTGLSTMRKGFYEIVSDQNILVEGYPCQFVTVQLKCDLSITPWCVSSS